MYVQNTPRYRPYRPNPQSLRLNAYNGEDLFAYDN